jgi:hypothetical protein
VLNEELIDHELNMNEYDLQIPMGHLVYRI